MRLVNFSRYLLKGRREAILLALLFTMIPFFHWVSVVIVAFIVLQKGLYEGLMVLMWSSLPYVVLAGLGYWQPLIDSILLGSLCVFGLAALLRRLTSLKWTIQIAALFFVGAIFLLHTFFPHLSAWWADELLQTGQLLAKQATFLKINTDQIKALATLFSEYATGVQAMMILLFAFINLLIARYLQLLLVSPVIFRLEWLSLKLDYFMSILFMVFAVIAFLPYPYAHFLKDALPVFVLIFSVAGISLIHGYLSVYRRAWVNLFYIMLIVFTIVFPAGWLGIILAAWLDSFLNLRKYFSYKMSK